MQKIKPIEILTPTECYKALMMLIAPKPFLTTCLLMLLTFGYTQEELTEGRWGSNFKQTCFSEALNAEISFPVRVPPQVEGLDKYPLVVVLKSGLQVAPSEEYPFFEVEPPSGGIWGYRSLSAIHIRTVIDFMKAHYPVDEDRIYLVGYSAGASGAMQLASTDADQFAAVLPLVAVGTDYPIQNFRNLPIAQHHGTVDWTSSICNARAQHQRLQEMGCPSKLIEYESVGHSVPLPHEPIVKWMLQQERQRSPNVVTHECETAAYGQSYWLKIDQFIDPHRKAKIDGALDKHGVLINTDNVGSFSIDLGLVPTKSISYITVGNQKININGLADQVMLCLDTIRKTWSACERVSNAQAKSPPEKAEYHAGASANLYEGDPLLIVYGSASGNQVRSTKLREVANRIALCGGPHAGSLTQGFQVIADRDLTSEQLKNFNLILIGKPGDNYISTRFFPDFPLEISENVLHVEGREGLLLQGRVLSLLYRNPEYQNRLVYVVAPFVESGADWAKFVKDPQRFLIGSDGFDRISQADLSVKTFDAQFCRQMQFDQNWQWKENDGEKHRMQKEFGDRSVLAREFMKLMRQKSEADFALWWGPADQGMWGHDLNFLPHFDSKEYRLADFRTQHRTIQTMTGKVSGKELLEIWDRWGRNEEMIFEPSIDLPAIEITKLYKVHIPMDFYIKLGQREKALIDPHPGPQIKMEELEEAIFRN